MRSSRPSSRFRASALLATVALAALVAPPAARAQRLIYTDWTLSPGSVFYVGVPGERALYRAPAGNLYYATLGPEGALYYTNANDRKVMRWTGTTLVTLYTHTTYVRDLGFDPLGRLHFSEASGAGGDGKIYRLDSGTPVLVRTVPLASVGGSWAGNFVFAPDGTLYYSTGNRVGASIYRVAGGATTAIYTDPAGAISGIDVDAAGNVYYANWSSRIYRVTPGGVRTVVMESPGRRFADVHLPRSAAALGPEAGRATSVAIDPSNQDVLYAGMSGGGVYRSPDRGRSWEWRARGISFSRVGDVLVYPPSPSTVLAVGAAGVFRSTDSGMSWTQTLAVPRDILPPDLPAPVRSLEKSALRHAPAEGAVYAAPHCAGLYRSGDGGGTWTQVYGAGMGLPSRCVSSVDVSPSGGGTVYITTPAGIRQRVAGGAWTAIGTEITGAQPIVLRVAPSSPDRLYVAVYNLFSWPPSPNVWGRDGAGAPFVRTTTTPPWLDWFWPMSLAVDPTDASRVWYGTVPLYRTGPSWALATGAGSACTSSAVCGVDYRGLTLDASGTTLYAAHDQGIFRHQTQANTFVAVDTGLVNGELYDLDAGPGGSIYIGTQDLGARRYTPASGWTIMDSHGSGDVLTVLADPADDLHLFIRTNSEHVLRSSDGGATVDTSNTIGAQGFWNHQLAYHRPTTRVWTGSKNHGVYRSTDNGVTFALSNTGMGNVTVRALGLQPGGTGQVLYAGTLSQGVFRTGNGGTSWSPLTTFPAEGALAFAFTPDGARVYAGTRTGVYVSTDGGATWAPRNTGLPAGAVVSELAIDPACACRMYAGLGYHSIANVFGGGVYESTDGGMTWTRITNDRESSVAVTSIRIDPTDASRLLVATYGAGALVLFRAYPSTCSCP